jgi:hypothetical protein
MSLFSLLGRVLFLLIMTGVPLGAAGYSVGGAQGSIVSLSLLGLALLAALWRAEKGILSIYHVRPAEPEGPRRSLDRVIARYGGVAPRVFSFSDPSPQALVARGPGSPGSILLSEGLLGALSEEELRELLDASVIRLRSRGIWLQTLCARLAHGILELAPRSWLELVFGELRWHEALGAWGALRFLTVLSAAKFFVSLGRGAPIDAPRGLSRLPVVSGEIANPGSCILHFSNPWAPRGLLVL